MDYNSLALLTYQLRKVDDKKKQEEIEHEAKQLIDHYADNDPEQLYDLYKNNAAFAARMSMVLQESAAQLYTRGILEKESATSDEQLSKSLHLVEDAVIWDEISTDFASLLEMAEESAIDDEDEEEVDDEDND